MIRMQRLWSRASLWSRAMGMAALAALALPAFAQPRAWLDRDQIGAGETVTLNIEAPGMSRPDYTPLQRDFVLSGRSTRSQMDASGVRTLHAVALRPRRDGVLVIPPLAVGTQRTAALTLRVSKAAAPAPSRAGDDVFLEARADDSSPYVQQAVGWVVRLYSATPLISGHLEQPAPDGASLQQIGEDARYSREIAGRRHEVVERRYLLIPERSGEVTLPGPRFEGRGMGGFLDDLFGARGRELNARAADTRLQVRPAPAGAPQPWLPLHHLQLRYVSTPSALHAGAAGVLTIEALADGANAAQMPELELPPIDGVQVFPEPVQADETFRDGRPRVKLTRRFSLVPSRAGAASLPGLRLPWWDVAAGSARVATLPPLSWTVLPGPRAGAAPNDAAASAPGVAEAPPGPATSDHHAWVAATVLFAALWLLTLLWALHRRSVAPHPVDPSAPVRIGAGRGPTLADLKRALDTADLGEVAQVLCAMATPPATDVDQLRERLGDPAQREAVDVLQHARWGGGDAAAARQRLRGAFAQGPHWRAEPAPSPDPRLAPLYPPG